MPQLFELVEYIEKHFELPAKIKKLIYAYDKREKTQKIVIQHLHHIILPIQKEKYME